MFPRAPYLTNPFRAHRQITMIASTFFVIAAIAQAAFAQMISPPPGTPQCLIACSNQFCPTSEMSCICQQELQDITACVLTNCSGADLTAAESLAPRLCRKIPHVDWI